MKKKILPCLFLAFTFMVSASAESTLHRLDGVWLNVERHDFIRIKSSGDEIFIKGLPLFQGAIRFQHQYGKTFRDKWGHRLTLEDGQTMYIKWSRHESIRFIKVERDDRRSRSHDSNHGHHDRQRDQHWDNGEQYRSYDNDNDWDEYNDSHKDENNDDYRDHDSGYGKNDVHKERLEGTYTTSIKDKEFIAILETRDGLKAKVSGSNDWKEYMRSKVYDGEYVDKDGNSYIFNNRNLLWKSKKQNGFTIELQKISDDVQY